MAEEQQSVLGLVDKQIELEKQKQLTTQIRHSEKRETKELNEAIKLRAIARKKLREKIKEKKLRKKAIRKGVAYVSKVINRTFSTSPSGRLQHIKQLTSGQQYRVFNEQDSNRTIKKGEQKIRFL